MPSVPPADPHELRGRASPDLLDGVHRLLAEFWRAHPEVGDRDRMLFDTALAEIAANVVSYAGDPVEVRLELRFDGEAVAADLHDDGRPAPADIVDAPVLSDDLAESGRGLALARAALDELAYRREGDENHWVLVRRLRA